MPTLMQKLRLALRGWSRRRDEAKKEFVARNASWGTPQAPASAAVPTSARPTTTIDIDGLTVAYLDDSGHFAHFLDTDTGDVLDTATNASLAPPRYRRIPRRTAESESQDRRAFVDGLQPSRYRRIPRRTAESESQDRRAFVDGLQPSRGRDELARAIGVPEAFRKALSNDRALERAWYNFKNDRAIAAIESWLRGERLK